MDYGFHLIDLVSQARAVGSLLRDRSPKDKIAWLAERGTLNARPKLHQDERQIYHFESSLGFECIFFLDGETLVFLMHHTTFMATEE
jgi:hypothetical protein